MKDQLEALMRGFRRKPRTATIDGPLVRAILSTGLFDAQWYATQRPNLPSVLDLALGHFLEVGWKEGLDPSPRFSTRGYLASNPEVAAANQNPLLHYLTVGRLQGRTPGIEADGTNSELVARSIASEFDSKFYAANNPDVSRAGYSPLAHFLSIGWKNGRDPHPQFSTQHYLDTNPDVRAAGINPYYHYLIAGRREGRIPNPTASADSHMVVVRAVIAREFDATYYLSAHEGVRESGVDVLTHYIERGWKLGFDPNAEFSTSYYLTVHADVRNAAIDPFYHYLTEGRREGRATSAVTKAAQGSDDDVRNAIAGAFDSDFYLAQYPDVARAGVDPIVHYVRHGWREGRDPHPQFSTKYYLSAYPDIREAGINPFYHFVIAGRGEGRLPTHPGGWKVKVLEHLQPVQSRRPTHETATALADDSAIAELRQVLVQQGARFVVSLSHDDYTTSVGGVQLCIKLEESAARASGRHHLNLHPARPIPLLSKANNASAIELCATLNGTSLGVIAADQLIGVLGSAQRAGARAELVVHSLIGHSPEVLVAIHRAVAPARSLFWLHDYFSVCPSYTLLRNEITYCGAPPLTSTACNVCAFGEERHSHLDRIREAFSRIPFDVISPSNFTRDLWRRAADLPHKSLSVRPHCTIEWSIDAKHDAEDGPVRIAFIGHAANHKGWQTFIRLLDEFGADDRYEFHHIGAGNRQHGKVKFTKASVIDGGPLAMRDALVQLDIDAVLVGSIWPETFSFVAYEALSAGALLLAREDAGNVAAVARETGGRLFSSDNDLFETLRGGLLHEQLLRRRRDGFKRGTPVFGKMSVDMLDAQEAAP